MLGIWDTHFNGLPPEGACLVLSTDDAQLVCGRQPELLPECRRCGAPTLVEGYIKGKYIDLNRWDDLRVWCSSHVPLWVRVRDRLVRRRKQLRRIAQDLVNRW